MSTGLNALCRPTGFAWTKVLQGGMVWEGTGLTLDYPCI